MWGGANVREDFRCSFASERASWMDYFAFFRVFVVVASQDRPPSPSCLLACCNKCTIQIQFISIKPHSHLVLFCSFRLDLWGEEKVDYEVRFGNHLLLTFFFSQPQLALARLGSASRRNVGTDEEEKERYVLYINRSAIEQERISRTRERRRGWATTRRKQDYRKRKFFLSFCFYPRSSTRANGRADWFFLNR